MEGNHFKWCSVLMYNAETSQLVLVSKESPVLVQRDLASETSG